MQDSSNIIQLEDKVNCFLQSTAQRFDSQIADLFKVFRIADLLDGLRIWKRCGVDTVNLVFHLVLLPFLSCSNICMFIPNIYEKTVLSSSSLYRLMSNHRYNWRKFQLKVARRILLKLEPDKTQKKNPVFFVLDDTIRFAKPKVNLSRSCPIILSIGEGDFVLLLLCH